jgi:hypothetical protein
MTLSYSIHNKHLITAACFNDWKGLVGGNGYIIKGFGYIDGPNGKKVRLIKVKNPWKTIGDPNFTDMSHGDFIMPETL